MTSSDSGARPLPSAVLFDLDGTLVDSLAITAGSFVEAFATEGYSFTPEQILGVISAPFVELVPRLIGPTTPELISRLGDTYGRIQGGRLGLIEPLPGAISLLEALATAQVPLALVTNRREASAAIGLATQKWESKFAIVIGAESAPRPKPAPDPALLALERLGVEPSAAAYVGDSVADIECAVAAGIPIIIGLAIAGNAEALTAAGATQITNSLADVEALLLGREVFA